MATDAILALALLGSIAARPHAWEPEVRTLDARLLEIQSPYYELFNKDFQQDPVWLGLLFEERQPVAQATFGFSSLGGRVYEPSKAASGLEVLIDGRWRPIAARRRFDYTHAADFAPCQGRGTAYWTYGFQAVVAEGIRLRVDAPAHSDPGYRCVALAFLSASGQPAGFETNGEVVGQRPEDSLEALRPGSNFLEADAGATVRRRRGRTEVAWARPLMVNAIRLDRLEGSPKIEYKTSAGWREAAAVECVANSAAWRFRPVATDGLRIDRGILRMATLDAEGARYFDQARQSRSDLLGSRFRAADRMDLAEMESYLLPIDFSMAAIGRPADLHETMVLWDGKFLMVDGGEGLYPRDGSAAPAQSLDRWFAPICEGRDWGADYSRTRSQVVKGGHPAITTRHERNGWTLEQTLFVTSPDDPYYANVALVKVENRSKSRRKTSVGYAMGLRPIWQPEWTPFLQDPWPTRYRLDSEARTVRNEKGEIVVHSDRAGRWGGTARENHFEVPVELDPGEETVIAFSFPNVDAPIKEMPDADPPGSWVRFCQWWSRTLSKTSVDLPEGPLNDIVANMLAQSMIVALDGDQVRYGAYFYEMYFGVEEGWPAVALAQFGQAKEARQIVETMLSDEHLDKSNHHHQYRNGLAPWYAITVARLLDDRKWLDRLWPKLKAAADWTVQSTTNNRDPEYGGILPRHVYGGDIGNPAYSFYSNAVCWRGLADTAWAAEWLGRGQEAAAYRSAAASYRARLLELADRLVDRKGGLPFLPMAFEIGGGDSYRKAEPAYPFLATHTPSTDLWNYLGNYWNLFAPMLLEVRLFPCGDERERWVPDYMEQRGGILAGLVRFDLGFDSVYGKGYIEALLQQGRRKEFWTALYGLFGHSISRSFYVMPEVSKVFDLRTDNERLYREHQRMRWNFFYRFVSPWLEGWQGQEGDPLAAGAGMALQALRMALVREDVAQDPPERLILLDGAPPSWFLPGKRIAFERMNTALGPVSLSCVSSEKGCEVELEVPKDVKAALRLPGRPFSNVTIDGSPIPSTRTIELRGSGKRAVVRAFF
ncbi:MAG TPA: hypothetical protein VGE01_02140 [Fimbriimonas sp.]